MKILVINGPNLNLLGTREPEKYGFKTLEDIGKEIYTYSFELGVDVELFQSNHEGEIIEKIQKAINSFDGILINPAGYSHTSVAIRDSIAAIGLPCVEVHLTNIHAREEFRQKSLIAPVCVGQISGFNKNSYLLGLKALCDYINSQKN